MLQQSVGHGAGSDGGQAAAAVEGMSEHVSYHRCTLPGRIHVRPRDTDQLPVCDDPVVYALIHVA